MQDQPHAVVGPSPDRRRWVIIGAIGLALAMQAALRSMRWSGVIVSSSGEVLSYRPSAWWLAIFAVPAGLMALIGVAAVTVRHPLARLVGALALLGALSMLVVIAPTTLNSGLVVTPEGFTHTAGFWWSPEVRQVRFDEIASLRVAPVRRREGPPYFVLVCRRRDGEVVGIPRSDVLKAGLPAIIVHAVRRGVDVARAVAEHPDGG